MAISLRRLTLRGSLFVSIGLAVLFTGSVAEAENIKADVLVVHDGKTESNISKASAVYLQQLLGHFSLRSDICSIDDYKSGQLFRYRFGFFISKSNKPAPIELICDIKLSNRPFFWVNSDVGVLGEDFLRGIGLESSGYKNTSRFKRVKYKGRSLGKSETSILLMKVTNPKLCRVYAWAHAPGRQVPYIVQAGKLWVVADCPFSYSDQHDRLLVFADLLHDFLGISHDSVRRVLFRVEDVNSSSSPAALSRLADTLRHRNLPFAVSVIPEFIDPQRGLAVPIKDRPELVQSLKNIARYGGSIVAHGYTHQYRGTTASDFEFWDSVSGKPATNASSDQVHVRIEKAVNSLLAVGLYPLAWETPHYAASSEAYDVIGSHFSTSLEPKTILDRLDYSQSFPFIIQRDIYGQRIIPENLGYVAYKRTSGGKEDVAAERRRVSEILRSADDMSVLRDACVGVFFHPFLDPSLASALVDGLKLRGYKFIDLRLEPNTVRTATALIGTGRISGTLDVNGLHLEESYIYADGVVRREISDKTIAGSTKKTVCPPAGCIYVCRVVSKQADQLVMPTQNTVEMNSRRTACAAILWNSRAVGEDEINQISLERAFSSIAVKPERVRSSDLMDIDLSRFNLLIVPQSSARGLKGSQLRVLADRVRSGAGILIDGTSPLAKHFNFRDSGISVEMKSARDLLNNQVLTWRKAIRIPSVSFPSGAVVVYAAFDERPIGGWTDYGNGQCFFLSTMFDPTTRAGYSRFPSLPSAVLHAFRLKPTRVAKDVEFYFDPGYRNSHDLDQLVTKWRRNGVRAIHAAAWYTNKNNRYDYARLIDICHRNGILVYAWFELPYVSTDFYKAHPEWHEKTAAGTDSKPGWRLPMALEVPECRAAVSRLLREMLGRYDWDGANLAELYFECMDGPNDPSSFVPMHPYVRKVFQSRYHYDATDLFDPKSAHYWKTSPGSWRQFDDLRAEMLRGIYIDLLKVIDEFRRGTADTGDREVVVTVLDSISAPEIRRNTGQDVLSIIDLMRVGNRKGTPKFDFTLNIEDPQRMWSDPPERYARIGETYRKLVSDPRRLMLNMNVLDFRKPGTTPFPTLGQTGAELAAMVLSAKSVVPRVLIYSESSVSQSDSSFLSAMMASTECWDDDGQCTNLEYPCSSYMQMEDGLAYVNTNGGSMQTSDTGEVPLVSGNVNVERYRGILDILHHDVPIMHLLNLSGCLLNLRADSGSLVLVYDSLAPCLITIDQRVDSLFIDGERTQFRMWKSGERWVLRCPSGHHEARIVSKSRTLFHTQVASSILSHAVTFAGYFAVFLAFSFAVSVAITRRLGGSRSFHK